MLGVLAFTRHFARYATAFINTHGLYRRAASLRTARYSLRTDIAIATA
jgi:hypothetical protein